MEHSPKKSGGDSARSFSSSQFMRFAKEQARRETLSRDYEASSDNFVQPLEDPNAKEVAEEKRKRVLLEDQVRQAFFLSIDRLRKLMRYQPVPDRHEISLKQLEVFWKVVKGYHHQIFTAAGFTDWMTNALEFSTSSKSRLLEQLRKFEGPEPSEQFPEFNDTYNCIGAKLKQLILRDIIWTCAEQVHHCPQRINQLFYEAFQEQSNLPFLDDTNDVVMFFLCDKELEPMERVHEQFANFAFPVMPFGIRRGIEEFKQGLVNFDDIDDCGRWNDLTNVTKTFMEVPGAAIFFLLLKYMSSHISLKLWVIALLYFSYDFGNPLPYLLMDVKWEHCNNDTVFRLLGQTGIPALGGFVLLDLTFLTLFVINEWVVRLYVIREKHWKYMTHSLRGRLALHMLQPVIGWVAVVMCKVLNLGGENPKCQIQPFWNSLDTIATYYLIMRIAATLAQEFLFPFVPLSVTQETKNELGQQKHAFFSKENLWNNRMKRMFARYIFNISVFGLCMLYEWFLIVPTISLLFKNIYCGDKTFEYGFDSLNTQHLICWASTICLWWITGLSLVVDNGLCFILAMSFFGWVRGFKTQGGAKPSVQITEATLFNKVVERFFPKFKHELKMLEEHKQQKLVEQRQNGNNPKLDLTQEEIDAQKRDDEEQAAKQKNRIEKARVLWEWCVNYWRKEDLLSDSERHYFLENKNDKVLDTNLLSAPDAQRHIAFFLSSLDIQPLNNFSFDDIPATTVIIPCFSEKLMFEWNQSPTYSPKHEFYHLVSKHPEEWLNFIERLQPVFGEKVYALEERIMDDEKRVDPAVMEKVTEWLSMHDQLIYKCVSGAHSGYDALVELAVIEGGYQREVAEKLAQKKFEVILCMQRYQQRKGDQATLAAWMKKWPCFRVAIDVKTEDKPNMTPELTLNIPPHYPYASCFLEYSHEKQKVVFRHVLPRENELRLENIHGRAIQGKSVNQLNGFQFSLGNFIQVLDANQGGHATEYLKLPSLLKDFKFDKATSTIKHRIIGSREYIFTKNLGTVARCHAYQEWSFGTIVLRTYSDLGVRLHYGHPDVFDAAWVQGRSSMSKVNPDINTSEDVFAGFETLKCKENTKHVENIQFMKGRETGMANMSSFDSKISSGNVGILRSRDMYHIMERLDFNTGFLFFHGISGHFTTISLMMASMKFYLAAMFLVSFTGTSLKAFGGVTYSSEWLFHAGLVTVVPLIVEFMVEYGPLMGLFRSLIFFPISTLIYLFQMQTKHAAFVKGLLTGRSAHIDTGRGLAIYRNTKIALFRNFGNSHYLPIIMILFMIAVYFSFSFKLGGGTNPLIMVFVLCVSVLITPQVFNPGLRGGGLLNAFKDFWNFIVWVGKTETRRFYTDWISMDRLKKENTFLSYFTLLDMENLPVGVGDAIFNLAFNLVFVVMWVGIVTFGLYSHYQQWVAFFIFFWLISAVLYCIIFFLLYTYEQPLRILVVFLGVPSAMGYYLYLYSYYNAYRVTTIFIALVFTVKLLEAMRALTFDVMVLVACYKFRFPLRKDFEPTQQDYDENPGENICADKIYTIKVKQMEENKQKYLSWNVGVLNNFYLVHMCRMVLAIMWASLDLAVAVAMRPLWGNVFLFGATGNQKKFEYLLPMRKMHEQKKKYGLLT